MSRERILDETITTFLLNTCRLRPQISKHALQAVVCCVKQATDHPWFNDEEADNIPLKTGSVAEFYIEPMLPHVGDVDVMHHSSTRLAIPRGHPLPTQLPAEFSDYVKVWEIVDSHIPGYVYLPLRYLLTYCTDDDKYNYFEYDSGLCLSHWINAEGENTRHGPALLTDPDSRDSSHLSIDEVPCVRCLSWPPQAADWPTRHRNHEWPDSATVDRVVNDGCDVVGVAHRQCRQDEWMGKCQWRLSFSRAEIVLISSWMPVQQIVYHMLRVFVKTERLTDNGVNSKPIAVSNYHIKTLMLWTCETEPRSWWIQNLNLIRICAELMRSLSVWLTGARCPHYFVNNCNLVTASATRK